MRVLVTGASGLIGSALIPALTGAGHEVVRLQRGSGAGHADLHWDPAAGTIDDLSGIDAVIHLAGVGIGEQRWTDTQKQAILNSRTVGTRLVTEAIAAADPKPSVLISASAIGYYGDRGDEELTEASEPGTDFQADVCRQWEAATEPAEASGVRTLRVRSGIVLTAKGGALQRMLLPFKMGLGGRIGSGRQWMSWISLDDEIGAVVHLLESDVAGPVNLTAPSPVTNREFTKTLGNVLKRPTVLPTPVAGVKAVYGRELVDALLLGSQRVVGVRLAESGYQFQHPTLEEALRAVI